jgi:hypothetical protein
MRTGSARVATLHLDLTCFVTRSGASLLFRSGDHIETVLGSRADLVGTRVTVGSSVDILLIPIRFRKASQ